jgi:hypothetical protein
MFANASYPHVSGLDDEDRVDPIETPIPPCMECQAFEEWATRQANLAFAESIFQGGGGRGIPGLTVGQVQQQLNLLLGLEAGRNVSALATMAFSENSLGTQAQYAAIVSGVFNRINTPQGYQPGLRGSNRTVLNILNEKDQFQGFGDRCNAGCVSVSDAGTVTNVFMERAFMSALSVYNCGQPPTTTTATAFWASSDPPPGAAGLKRRYGAIETTPSTVLLGPVRADGTRHGSTLYLYNYAGTKGR